MSNFWILSGVLSCAICVIVGAFGAHSLKDILTEYGREIYDKANLYHFMHSLALIINGILQKLFIDLNFNLSGYLFLIGIVLFSFYFVSFNFGAPPGKVNIDMSASPIKSVTGMKGSRFGSIKGRILMVFWSDLIEKLGIAQFLY